MSVQIYSFLFSTFYRWYYYRMDQDDIIQSIKCLIHNLDTIKNEYGKIVHSLESEQELDLSGRFIDKIDSSWL